MKTNNKNVGGRVAASRQEAHKNNVRPTTNNYELIKDKSLYGFVDLVLIEKLIGVAWALLKNDDDRATHKNHVGFSAVDSPEFHDILDSYPNLEHAQKSFIARAQISKKAHRLAKYETQLIDAEFPLSTEVLGFFRWVKNGTQ